MWISELILKKDLTFLCSSKFLPKFVPRMFDDVIVKLLKFLGLWGFIVVFCWGRGHLSGLLLCWWGVSYFVLFPLCLAG